MKSLRSTLAAALLGASLTVLPLSQAPAEPTETTFSGLTSVRLAPEFLGALTQLNVRPGQIIPGRIIRSHGDTIAAFPITAGAIDLGAVRAEIAHSGGLTLTAGDIRVELSSFLIDLTGDRPVLTGLVVANDSLVGRIPLFDLDLASVNIEQRRRSRIQVSPVAVSLSAEAAEALNGVFSVDAFVEGIPIGEATVLSFVGPTR